MAKPPKNQDEPTEEEIERRRDKIARRMLNTPPKPHKPKTTGDENPRKKSRKEKG